MSHARFARKMWWMETVDQSSDTSKLPAEENRESQRSRRTLRKYVLFQIPGIVLVGLLLIGLRAAELLPTVTAVLFFFGWCAKDALMYRFVRSAYEPGPPHGTAALVGMRGVVVDDLDPKGSVRLGAEHWTARPAGGVSSLSRGSLIRVVSVDGFTVTVVGDGQA
jgi:membrane protein implicated in regulation of membrane protease activity